MSRSVPWRRICPDKVAKRIQRASRAQIYLLRTTGPTGFLLTAEGDDRKFKVFLGDPHTCTCPVFLKERDLCLHIMWVLIKKFRVPKENPVIYQLGLVEREIGEVVRGIFADSNNNQSNTSNRKNEQVDSREKLSKKEITKDDVCPICQDDLLGQTQPTTHCKYGCGNSIHIKCMKVWADHQKSSGETIIKCPLCRVDFGSFEILKKEYLKSSKFRQSRPDLHVGTVCAQCEMSPISGKCYRCNICSNYLLCKECFRTNSHADHPFVFRQKSNQRWRPASTHQAIPQAVANDLQSREISENDYTLLLQLDGSSVGASGVPHHVLNSFPVEKITSNNHRLAVNDEKCGVCYQAFKHSQMIRRLPCKHEFHRHCIDSWLTNDHNTCPIDGQTVNAIYETHASSSSSASNQQNSRARNTTNKKALPMSTIVKKQKQRAAKQEDCLLQNFSLNGLALRKQRRIEDNMERSTSSFHRTNSAPPTVEVAQSTASSSKHITFDSNMFGRAKVSTEHIMRYGRHSGDSRLRRCTGFKANTQTKNSTNLKKQLPTDITLCGKAISTFTPSTDGSVNNNSTLNRLQQNPMEHQFNVVRTSIVSSSPESGFNNIPVDI